MRDFFIYFLKSENDSKMVLGRKASDFVLQEFQNLPHQILIENESPTFDVEGDFQYFCVFYLDMALLSKNAVRRAVDTMWRRNIPFIRTGEGYIVKRGHEVSPQGFSVNDDSFLSIGDTKAYELVYNNLRQQIVRRHITAEVEIADEKSVHIDDTVIIEPKAKILPFTRICGKSAIHSGAEISASELCDCEIEANASVIHSYLTDSYVGESATVGPYARLRGAKILARARVGDFVEVKASTLGEGAKVAHLTYIGDAEVGARTNLGCGTVFCNYDGKLKHHTKVGEDCFIGANTNLIAPIEVGDRAFVAAGTTLTKSVDSDVFCIGRVRQEIREKPYKKDSKVIIEQNEMNALKEQNSAKDVARNEQNKEETTVSQAEAMIVHQVQNDEGKTLCGEFIKEHQEQNETETVVPLGLNDYEKAASQERDSKDTAEQNEKIAPQEQYYKDIKTKEDSNETHYRAWQSHNKVSRNLSQSRLYGRRRTRGFAKSQNQKQRMSGAHRNNFNRGRIGRACKTANFYEFVGRKCKTTCKKV